MYMDAVQKTKTLASLLSSKQGIDKAKRVMVRVSIDISTAKVAKNVS